MARGPDIVEAQPRADDDADAVLLAARGGDEAAFRSLYTSMQPGLLRYARVLIGRDAEDVTAEAWLQIVRDLRTFSGTDAAFRGWAATIVRNRALDLVRRRTRHPVDTVTPDSWDDRVDDATVWSAVDEAITTERALALIATLPAGQAEAVALRVVVGLDVESTARVLGKRPGSVRVAAHRGLRALAARLNGTAPRECNAPRAGNASPAS